MPSAEPDLTAAAHDPALFLALLVSGAMASVIVNFDHEIRIFFGEDTMGETGRTNNLTLKD